MPSNNIRAKILIAALICIIIFMVGVFVFKIINGDNKESQSLISKEELIEFIKSKQNTINYEVEYTTTSLRSNEKYFNEKMRQELVTDEQAMIAYIDFETNTHTLISEDKKTIIIQNNSDTLASRDSDELITMLEKANSKIEKEEKILDRNAIVVSYQGIPEEDGDYALKVWIDLETGIMLKREYEKDDIKEVIDYNIKLNSVMEEDVTVPDLPGYKVLDIRK